MRVARKVLFGLAVGLALSSSATAAPASPADAIMGQWKHPEENLIVDIVKYGDMYAGKVIVSTDHPKLLTITLLQGLSYDPAQREWRGEIFAPKRNEYVPVVAQLKPDGTLLMKAGKGMFVKELVWTHR